MQQRFLDQLAGLWPALKDSLAELRQPCIRSHCPACKQGDKQPAFILSFTQAGRRRCLYVSAELVALLRRGLENGRRREALLYQLGPALLQEHRQPRDKKPEL